MKYRQMPPIQWIPVFEAAARLLSFRKAADELHVTPPAISQQIKALESWLELRLFHRTGKQLSLTDAGEFYLDVAQRVMSEHKKGYIDFDRRFKNIMLTVSAPLFIAQEILIPNYLSFSDFLPDTELRIDTRASIVDFESEPMDAAVRFGDGNWPGLACRRLCYSPVTLVCSRDYLDKHPLNVFSDFTEHRLIYGSTSRSDWKMLFNEEELSLHEKLVCDSYMAAIKAASDGLGIALAIIPTANRWINEGRLVMPLLIQVDTDLGYWVVAPEGNRNQRQVDAFYNWMKSLFDALPELKVQAPRIAYQALADYLHK